MLYATRFTIDNRVPDYQALFLLAKPVTGPQKMLWKLSPAKAGSVLWALFWQAYKVTMRPSI